MKILEYAKHIRKLAHIQHSVSSYAENEWHNVSEEFFLDLANRSAFAIRTIPIHNANGYQGDIYQFMWRANMDYHQLLTSKPQPMQQPTTTNYAAQLLAVKTLPELFDFRAKLKTELNEEVCAYLKVFADATTESAQIAQITEIKFFIDRVESQIKSLESNGVFLAAVDGRWAVGTLELTSDPVPGVLELSPIEEKANKRGLLKKLRKLQSIVNECQWAYADSAYADSEFSILYDLGLVVKLSICDSSEYAYLWRHDMDYETFFQIKNPPKK